MGNIKHRHGIGIYGVFGIARDSDTVAYVTDDYGTLVPINVDQFKQIVYSYLGYMA